MIGQQTLPPWVTDPTEHPRWDGERIVPYSESVRESAPAVVGDGSPTGRLFCAFGFHKLVVLDVRGWFEHVRCSRCLRSGVRPRG